MGKPLNEYGEIVAIVEAKRASIDPRSAILTLLHAVMPNTTITGVLKPFAGGYIIPSNPWASIRLSAKLIILNHLKRGSIIRVGIRLLPLPIPPEWSVFLKYFWHVCCEDIINADNQLQIAFCFKNLV